MCKLISIIMRMLLQCFTSDFVPCTHLWPWGVIFLLWQFPALGPCLPGSLRPGCSCNPNWGTRRLLWGAAPFPRWCLSFHMAVPAQGRGRQGRRGIVEGDCVEQPPCTRRRWRNGELLDAGRPMPKHRPSQKPVQLDFAAAVSSVPTTSAGTEVQVP